MRGTYPSVLPESLAPDVKLELKGVGWMGLVVVVEELVESQQRAEKHLCMVMKTELSITDPMHRWTQTWNNVTDDNHQKISDHSIKIQVHDEILQITQGQAPVLITR